MAHRSIEETFQAIRPRGSGGIPDAPVIGAASSGGGLATALSEAGQQIAQLQATYQRQVQEIAANTQAIQGNTSAQAGHSAVTTAGVVASGVLGGALGLLSPLVSGIAHLFGGGSSKPEPLSIYVPPAPISIEAALQSTGQASGNEGSNSNTRVVPQVTVNVSAMDSQSFLDRSTDIANAVREAMLNLHPINDVVANL